MYGDREYAILESVSKDTDITQRELSKTLGISLGTVNILLNKMQREGLIKIKSISAKRAAYMLTPKGMAEKAEKTLKYIVKNYKYINETKDKIKDYLRQKLETESKLYLAAGDTEVIQMVLAAASELGVPEKLQVIKDSTIIDDDGLVILINNDDKCKFEGIRVETFLEKL